MGITPNNETSNKKPEEAIPIEPIQDSTLGEIKEIETEIARAQAELEAAQAKLREKTSEDPVDIPVNPVNIPAESSDSPPPPKEYYWQQAAQQNVQAQDEAAAQSSQPTAQEQNTQSNTTSQASPNNTYQAPPQPQRAYVYAGAASKDHIAAGLLAIFLGTLGIHKFYLGYNTAGFIMLAITVLGSLLTFGLAGAVMAVIAIIEGILYLVKSQSEFEATYVFNTREWF